MATTRPIFLDQKSEARLTRSPSTQKAVTIHDEPEHIDINHPAPPRSPRLHRASMSSRRLVGRPPLFHQNSTASITDQITQLDLESSRPTTSESTVESSLEPRLLLSQVKEWLEQEKSKRRRHHRLRKHLHRENDVKVQQPPDDEDEDSLSRLEQIVSSFQTGLHGMPKLSKSISPSFSRKGSLAQKLKRGSVTATSDTEAVDHDILVPNVEAYLDNTKTLSYSGGAVDPDASRRDLKHWIRFKEDALRLTHTLRLRGWRRLPMENASDIEISRLSGALTNAVYVVKPPTNWQDIQTGSSPKRPSYLLLRVYGPQADHLIDRDAELNILRRLARKNIGPRLLGSFTNGRFEEFLHAKTLTADDLRDSETSKQIAKRMRELHDGIELLPSEYEAGPAVFGNWDRWVERCEKIVVWLDNQARSTSSQQQVDYLLGLPWQLFLQTYKRARAHLLRSFGGSAIVRQYLVFAHNDTQYGNLLRLLPASSSPLLLPVNHHRQLIVIDFEYASPNPIGIEFANHFTEWCYNYHHSTQSWRCDTRRYPSVEEQRRFVRAYVMHRPQFVERASATPMGDLATGREKTNIPDFMLDARTPKSSSPNMNPMEESTSQRNLASMMLPSGTNYEEEERQREKRAEEDIQRLMRETQMWRVVNSAMWVLWGIVQAKLPEFEAAEKAEATKRSEVGEQKEGEQQTVETSDGADTEKEEDAHDKESDEETLIEKATTSRKKSSVAKAKARRLLDKAKTSYAQHRNSWYEEAVVEGEPGDRSEPNGAKSNAESSTTSEKTTAPQDQVLNSTNEEALSVTSTTSTDASASTTTTTDDAEDESSEFDYLAYARDRAMFFWGDAIQLGITKEDDLPEGMRREVKVVDH